VVDLPKYPAQAPILIQFVQDVSGLPAFVEFQLCAIFLRSDGEVIGAVHAGRVDARGFQYTGDGLSADLAAVPGEVAHVFILVHAISDDPVTAWKQASLCGSHLRVSSSSAGGEPLVSHECGSLPTCRHGLLLGRLFRSEQDLARWTYQEIGSAVSSQTWVESAVEVKRFYKRVFAASCNPACPALFDDAHWRVSPSSASTEASTPLCSPRPSLTQTLDGSVTDTHDGDSEQTPMLTSEPSKLPWLRRLTEWRQQKSRSKSLESIRSRVGRSSIFSARRKHLHTERYKADDGIVL